jgi:CRISPR-associated protein Cas2
VKDRQRRKLSDMLLDYGESALYSVFEADLTKADVQEILAKAAKYVEKQDSLRFYPVCENCLRGIRSLGRKPIREEPACKVV